jgi:hypothetical protein
MDRVAGPAWLSALGPPFRGNPQAHKLITLMFWLCFETPEGVCVVLQPAPSLIHARLMVGMAGIEPGSFKEGHALDDRLSKRIPKNMIGKCLSPTQAVRLLNSWERKRA